MSKWEKVKLGDICDVRDGTHDSPKYVAEGYPLVTSKNLSNGIIDISEVNLISKEDFEKINTRSGVDNGDIIMPMIGTIGNPVIVEKKFDFAIKNVALIKFSEKNISNRYINYVLKSDLFKQFVEKENRGGTQRFISLSNIRKFVVPLPPLETQKQIAKTLDTAAELLAMRKQQLVELDNLIKSTFYEIFGDPVENEKGWDLVKLGDIGRLNSGGTPTRSNPNYFTGGTNWFSAGELNQRYLTESKEKLTLEAIANSSAKIFKKNSMLIGMYDTAAFKLGILTKDSSSNQACANIEVDSNVVSIEWLYDCAQIMRPYFLENRRGVRQKNLNLSMIKNFEIPLPPYIYQKQFTDIVFQIEQQKELVIKSISETQYLFDSLMSQYFE